MRWYIIGRKAYYRTRCFFKVAVIALLLLAFSVSVVQARYDRELFVEAAGSGETVRLVVIDAGHGGEDGGTIGKNGILEKEINLSIAFMVEDILKEKGYLTLMTRRDDRLLYDKNSDYKGKKKQLDLAARAEIAKKTADALFVSIHMNSFSQSRYKGLQVYYSKNDPSSEILAGLIQSSVRENVQPDNTRQTKKATSSIYVLDRITCPAVLTECGFLSNDGEAQKLSEQSYQKQLACAITAGIVKFLAVNTAQGE